MAYRLRGMRKGFKTEREAQEYAKAHWMDGTFKLFGGTPDRNDPDKLMLVVHILFKTDRSCDPEMVCEFGLGKDMVSFYPFTVSRQDLAAHGFGVRA